MIVWTKIEGSRNWEYGMRIMAGVIGLSLGIYGAAFAETALPLIDMEIVAHIESSGNSGAIGDDGDSVGLFQISSICLKEWNNFHPKDRHSRADLLDAGINAKIATWYMNERLPRLLRHYAVPVTVSSLILAWNCGIKCAVDGRWPETTRRFLEKYEHRAAVKAEKFNMAYSDIGGAR